MKKIFCVCLAAVLLFAAVLPVGAVREYKSLLLLGDSITYGYGLDGGINSPDSYGNRLRGYLKLNSANFKNAAVNGDTSADLLALLPSLDAQIAQADLIVVSVGGNDLLGILTGALKSILGSSASLEDALAVIADPDSLAKLQEYLSLATIINAVSQYTDNLTLIVEYIRSENAYADVIFLAQYDPMSGAGFGGVGTITEMGIGLLNAAMKNIVTAGGAVYLDIYTTFLGMGPEWTFIMQGDIHPNAIGHEKIFDAIVALLEGDSSELNVPAVVTGDDVPDEVLDSESDFESGEGNTDEQNAGETETAIISCGGEESGCKSLVMSPVLLCTAGSVWMIFKKRKFE